LPLILPWLGNELTVLDVGCNTGYMGRALLERFDLTIDGLEVDRATAAAAAPEYREVRIADLDVSPATELFSGKYDRILALDVIEHLRQPRRALEGFRALLKPTGALLLSAPNVAHYKIRLALLRGRFDYTDVGIMDRTHLRFYTHRTLRAELESAGFVLAEEQYAFNDLPLRKLIPRRLRRRLVRAFPGPFAYQFVIRAEIG